MNGATLPTGIPNGYSFRYDGKDDNVGSAAMFGELALTDASDTVVTNGCYKSKAGDLR